MERIPPTQKTDLEKMREAINEEREEWNKRGLNPNMTVHPPASLWTAKMQIRALMQLLIEKGIIEEEDMDLQFQTILLDEMQVIRGQAEAQQTQPNVAVPEIQLLDQHGRPLKL